MRIIATKVAQDEGTIVVFHGRDEDDAIVAFAVDHRLAADIAAALQDGEVDCDVEPWQVIGGVA